MSKKLDFHRFVDDSLDRWSTTLTFSSSLDAKGMEDEMVKSK